MTHTLSGVVNPKRIVSEDDLALLREVTAQKADADLRYRETVVAIAGRSSLRSTAEATGLAVDTVRLWVKDAS